MKLKESKNSRLRESPRRDCSEYFCLMIEWCNEDHSLISYVRPLVWNLLFRDWCFIYCGPNPKTYQLSGNGSKNQFQGLVVEKFCSVDFQKKSEIFQFFSKGGGVLVLSFVIIVCLGMIFDKNWSITYFCCLVLAKFGIVFIEIFVLTVIKKNWSFLFVFYFNIIATNVFFVFTFVVGASTIYMI